MHSRSHVSATDHAFARPHRHQQRQRGTGPPPAATAEPFLDQERLSQFDAAGYRSARPFPWAALSGILVDHRYRHLQHSLPQLNQFRKSEGKRRRYGQQSHDRYVLDYEPRLNLAPPWNAFIGELQCGSYRRFISRCLGTDRFGMQFHWHYTPRGCSVSPHCDAEWKLGSHIFYFNTREDWQEAWGGETLILDDDGCISFRSAPSFDDFSSQHSVPCVGNTSLMFNRTDHSWHGVRPLKCPEGVLRKVFIVEFVDGRLFKRLRSRLGM